MMEKVINVVHDATTKTMLKTAMNKMGIEDDIVYLPINLSFGYIPKDLTNKEVCCSLLSRYQILKNDGWKLEYPIIMDFISTDFSSYDKVIVWHGWSADELLLLYLMSTLLTNNFYQIDIRTSRWFTEKEPSFPQYPSMKHLCINDFIEYDMYSQAKKVLPQERVVYEGHWKKWSQSLAPYRFSDVQTGLIKGYSEDFMDDYILDAVKKETPLRHIVLRVLGKICNLHFPPAPIVYNRIMELSIKGVLEIKVSQNKEQ